jgi:hypothetical protein
MAASKSNAARFTAGERWTVEKEKVGNDWGRVVYAADGERVAVVADCGGGTPKRAHLIAAAPALYEALESLIHYEQDAEDPAAPCDDALSAAEARERYEAARAQAWAAARSALAQARGEA